MKDNRGEKMKDNEKIREMVKAGYTNIIKKKRCGCSCSCDQDRTDFAKTAKRIGYSVKDIKNIPAESFHGLGCGNPVALAELQKGETILDLGSGAGVDVFLAANRVGEKGLVIGVDMTEDMVKEARKNAKKHGYKNVDFKLGVIENLPVDDNSVDVIISNCVINLSPDKLKTFREAYRVLKPGGRIMVSDLVAESPVPETVRKDFKLWTGCVAGALVKKDYLNKIKKAGFENVEILSEGTWKEDKIKIEVTSITVKATKPF